MKRGIDVSHWNYNLDYTTLAKHIDFAIPQEGYGRNRNAMFMTHVKGFTAAKVNIPGVYHFIYSLDVTGAKEEARSAIESVKAAGLPETTMIWCDFEYDTVDYAKGKGITLGKRECTDMTRAFCETVQAAGYPTGIYCNCDYYENMYDKTLLEEYPIWLCDLSGSTKYPCMLWQYTWKGSVPGCTDGLDMDYLIDAETEDFIIDDEETARSEERTKASAISILLAIAEAEVGYREKASPESLEHMTANAGSANYTKYGRIMHEVQPSNMDYPAAWCDCFVDWCFYEAFGAELARKMLCGTFDDYTVASAQMYIDAGRWTQKGSRGDQIFFKDGSGICHTGLVLDVVGRIVYTIEGNKSNTVMKCQYDASDPSIAGYGIPRYEIAAGDGADGSCDGGACLIHLPEEDDKAKYLPGKVSVELRTMLVGAEHPQVKTIQRLLNALGYRGANGAALTVDGELGPQTAHAITSLQKAAGMEGINFGSVAARTWKLLLEAD